MMNKEYNDYEIIEGKPHLGIYKGTFVIINEKIPFIYDETDPIFKCIKSGLDSSIEKTKYQNKGFEIRHTQLIIKPPIIYDDLIINGTAAIKYMIWGRAFKVMKLLKKGGKRYRKKLINGHRKWVRIDKRKKSSI